METAAKCCRLAREIRNGGHTEGRGVKEKIHSWDAVVVDAEGKKGDDGPYIGGHVCDGVFPILDGYFGTVRRPNVRNQGRIGTKTPLMLSLEDLLSSLPKSVELMHDRSSRN